MTTRILFFVSHLMVTSEERCPGLTDKMFFVSFPQVLSFHPNLLSERRGETFLIRIWGKKGHVDHSHPHRSKIMFMSSYIQMHTSSYLRTDSVCVRETESV